MLMVQVEMNCYIKDPDGFDKDLREIGADWVLLSHCEFFESGEKRKKDAAKPVVRVGPAARAGISRRAMDQFAGLGRRKRKGVSRRF